MGAAPGRLAAADVEAWQGDPQCAPAKADGPVPSSPQCTATAASAPVQEDPQTALMTVVEPKLEVDATGTSPMDDGYDPASGTVTFSARDISLPGNFAIPVELSRWVPTDDYNTGGPTGWTWNLPFIRGNYLDVKDGHSDAGWNWGLNTWHTGQNCSGSADSVVNNKGELIAGGAYWQGKLLHIPGVTSETFLDGAAEEQITKSNFKIVSCINNAGGQQGIVVAGPNGLTYTFNQIKSYYNGKAALKDPIVRTRLLMVTKIEDRRGNRVDYSYTNGDLTQISASDGRTITINYELSSAGKRRPTTAVAHGRTWTYAYQVTGTQALLRVTLPDGVSAWTYDNVSVTGFLPNGLGGYAQQFRLNPSLPILVPSCSVASTQYTATVTSPGGLVSAYTFKDTIHYRANVEPDLYQDLYMEDYMVSRALYCTVNRSLTAKTVSGPGVGPYSWSFAYSTHRGTYSQNSGLNGYLTGPFDLPLPAVGGYPAPITAGTAVNYRSTTVTGPDQKTVFYIERTFQSIGENRVIAQDVLNAAGNQLLQRTESTFALGDYVGNHWYLCPCDGQYSPVNDSQLSFRINQTQSVDKRYASDGTDSYTTTFSNFDAYGFALNRQGSNSFSTPVQSIQTTYLHDTANGLIGLPLSETVNGTTAVEHHYNGLGQRDWTKAFGKLQSSMTYAPDGTLATVKDGLNQTTSASSWKRGMPQTVQFADGTSRLAVVNDHGWVTSMTDENGFATGYGYDAMGRLASIVHPTGDSVAWTNTTRSVVLVGSVEYGIPAGHWRQTTTTGNAKKITYFDAMWRPLVTHEYDAANVAGTQRFQRFAYDANGRLSFASYHGTTDALTTGTWSLYDALGRPTSMSQDSELGMLTTTTEYLSGFRTRVTNPRGLATVTTYQVFDSPNTNSPLVISLPEGVSTTITRDNFGKPKSISRSGSYAGNVLGFARYYVYDANERLCQTINPESGTTIVSYDLAGNLDWSAEGQTASGITATSCAADRTATPAGERSNRTYDPMNRVTWLQTPGNIADVSTSYFADGSVNTIATSNPGNNSVVTSYAYNRRRLMTGEASQNGSTAFYLSYGYNANAHLSTLTYPDGQVVGYSPDALGRATQVAVAGGQVYASAIHYFPTGAISDFRYGNNILHTMTPNDRQLPARSVDSLNGTTYLDDSYLYDGNGNVASIIDALPVSATSHTRTLGYDGLDRMITANSPNAVWGNASYSYDAIDNLRSADMNNGTVISDYRYNYDGNNRLTDIKNVAGATQFAFGYDVRGNTTSKNSQVRVFDTSNRMSQVTGVQTYRYDGLGRRVQTTDADTKTTFWMYSQAGQVLYSSEARRSQNISYVYLGNTQVATRSVAWGTGATTVRYQHTDALGSPVLESSAPHPTTGVITVLKRNVFSPWGEAWGTTVVDGTGYTGHVMDQGTGLTYMQQRYYDPGIGRFLSVDPVTVDGGDMRHFNRYSYAYNNPYGFTDPDGRCPSCIGAGVGAALEIVVQAVEIGVGARDRFDGGRIAISAVAGATGVGAAQLIGRGARLGSLAKIAFNRASDAGVSAGSQLAKDGDVSFTTTAIDVVAGATIGDAVAGIASSKAANSAAGKVLARQADRTARIAAQNPRSAKQAAAASASSAQQAHTTGAAAASGVSASNAASSAVNATCVATTNKSC